MGMSYVSPADVEKVLSNNGIRVNSEELCSIYDKLDIDSIEEDTDPIKNILIEKQLLNLKIIEKKKVPSMLIKVAVGCHGREGAEVHVVKVDCTKDQYEEGMHYDAAKGYVQENYDVDGPYWMVDEKDSAANMFKKSTWKKFDCAFVD